MSGDYEKYAVYWVPKRSDALARFGASWTGWCAENGERRTRGVFGNVSFGIAAVTRHGRRHGFHAVIKAPFRLGADRSLFTLEHALGTLVEECASFQLPRLRLAVVNECVALVPSQRSPALHDLTVRIGDALARIDVAPDAPAEAVTLNADGARDAGPVVRFPTAAGHRFQMPLTDPIGTALALDVMEQLQPMLEPILQQPRQLQDIALMGDPGEDRPLRVLQRYELPGWPLRTASGAMPAHGPHVLVANFNDTGVKPEIAI